MLLPIVMLLFGTRFTPRLPDPLIVVALAIAASSLFHLGDRGVKVVGDIQSGLATPAFPTDALSAWRRWFRLAVERVSAARSLAAKHGRHVDPNQEMLANGAHNAVSGLLQGMPAGGSLTRSSVSVEAGARTQLAVTILGLLLLGMLGRIALGIAFSPLDLLEHASFPHIAELGRIPDSSTFTDRDAHPKYQPADGVLVVGIDGSVVFARIRSRRVSSRASTTRPGST